MSDHPANRTLVCLDGSPHSEEALRYAIESATPGRTAIDLLYVVPDAPRFVSGMPTAEPIDIDAYNRGMDEMADRIVSQAEEEIPPDISHGRSIEHGPIASSILEKTRSGDYDVVVMGTRGLGAVRGLFMGSVSRRVVQDSEIPVLLVRAKGFSGNHEETDAAERAQTSSV